MTVIRTSSEGETEEFGELIGRAALPGWVIGLSGDLGSGKTVLVRGVGRGLGCTQRVHSPTFALLNEYAGGRLRLFHIDLYRLQDAAQVREAGLEEFLIDPPGVSTVEWIERWTGPDHTLAGPNPFIRIHLAEIDERTREISYSSPARFDE